MREVTFFGYSKNTYAVKRCLEEKHPNWKMVYSWGGIEDEIAQELNLPTCYVAIGNEYDGKLPVINSSKDAVNDYGYVMSGKTFAIRLH
jgi:hypothetical protein